MGAYWGRFYRPQAYQSVYIGFNTPSPKPLQTKEKPRDLNGSRGRTAEDEGNVPLLHLTCINNDRGFFGALMGPIYRASVARVVSGPNHIIFIENRPLREYFLLRKRKTPSTPDFSEIEGCLPAQSFFFNRSSSCQIRSCSSWACASSRGGVYLFTETAQLRFFA